MKTSKNINMKNSITLLSFAFASLLLMSSCEKKEIALPQHGSAEVVDPVSAARENGATKAEVNGSRASIYPVQAIDPIVRRQSFSMIKIDHVSARPATADYSVTVNAQGQVTFEGRKNCATIGKVSFDASAETMIALNSLYIESKFFSIVHNLSLYADLPIVFTTCTEWSSDRGKTLFDYNDEDPAALIYFRTKAESILGISRLVGKVSILETELSPQL